LDFYSLIRIFANGILLYTTMTQLVITLKDSSYLPNIRRIVKSLVGVEKVSVPRKKRLSRYEQSLLDAKEGRVNEYKDSDEFYKKMGI